MPMSSRSEYQRPLVDELENGATSSPLFDQDVASKIGKRISVRRSLCGLSQEQLGARLGIDSSDVDAYERGAKRINCKILLETTRQLRAELRFFFQ